MICFDYAKAQLHNGAFEKIGPASGVEFWTAYFGTPLLCEYTWNSRSGWV